MSFKDIAVDAMLRRAVIEDKSEGMAPRMLGNTIMTGNTETKLNTEQTLAKETSLTIYL